MNPEQYRPEVQRETAIKLFEQISLNMPIDLQQLFEDIEFMKQRYGVDLSSEIKDQYLSNIIRFSKSKNVCLK